MWAPPQAEIGRMWSAKDSMNGDRLARTRIWKAVASWVQLSCCSKALRFCAYVSSDASFAGL